MKPYGYERMHYDAKKRMNSDISMGNRPYSRVQTKAVLRIFKKQARRAAKMEIENER